MAKEHVVTTDWRKNFAESPMGRQLLTAADLTASIEEALQRWDSSHDLWIFAYGSLLWNPQMQFEEMRVGRVHGYHRSFCLWSRINRGTPERPGLVLGLDRGGSCGGLAYRVAARRVKSELAGLWEREMLLGSYHPSWVHFRSGSMKTQALTFVVDRLCSGYAGRLPDATMLAALRSAHGRYGSCADYMTRTVQSLVAHGIHDHRLMRLNDLLLKRSTS